MNQKPIIIAEKNKLVPLSRRFPFFYAEYSRIVKSTNNIKILSEDFYNKEGSCSLPVASIGSLLLGPGCSITTEAARVLNQRGCSLSFTGGAGIPLFLNSTTFRSPRNKLRQVDVILSSEKRLKAATHLLHARAKFISEFEEFGIPLFQSIAIGQSSMHLHLKELGQKLLILPWLKTLMSPGKERTLKISLAKICYLS